MPRVRHRGSVPQLVHKSGKFSLPTTHKGHAFAPVFVLMVYGSQNRDYPLSFQFFSVTLMSYNCQLLGRFFSGYVSVISCQYISLITFLKASSYLSAASGSCIASDTPHTVSATFTNPSLAAGLPGNCMSCTDTGNIQCISKTPGSGADGRCGLPDKCLALTGSLPRT